MKARTVDRHVAERGSKRQFGAALAPKGATTMCAAFMIGGEGGSLDRDEVLLHAGQKRLAFIERKADCLRSVVALVYRQHVGVIANDFAVVTNDPQSHLNTHGLPPLA